MGKRRWWVAWGVATLLVAGGMLPAWAEYRALVIGINDYTYVRPKLKGAVADAQDIAKSLQGLGVKDLTLLIDDQAERGRVVSEIQKLLQRSHKGDVVFLSYAGHGATVAARPGSKNKDGMDTVILLTGFQYHGEGTKQRIYDDEFVQWLHDFDKKEVKVIFVADSCHSGGLTRALVPGTPGGEGVTHRGADIPPITDDQLQVEVPAATEDEHFDHVTFIAASQKQQVVPEIRVPGPGNAQQRRGAVSYLFARALEGSASHSDKLSQKDLFAYLRDNTRTLSEEQQTPRFKPERGEDSVLVEGVPQRAEASQPVGNKVRLFSSTPLDQLQGAEVSAKDTADLAWDSSTHQVISHSGDVVAHDVGDAVGLQAVVEGYLAVQQFKLFGQADRLKMTVEQTNGTGSTALSGDALHKTGDELRVTAGEIKYPYFILLDLTGSGEVQLQYPQKGDNPRLDGKSAYALDFAVAKPFGSDHILAIASETDPGALVGELARLDGTPASGKVFGLVQHYLANTHYQIGMQGIYTAP